MAWRRLYTTGRRDTHRPKTKAAHGLGVRVEDDGEGGRLPRDDITFFYGLGGEQPLALVFCGSALREGLLFFLLLLSLAALLVS